MSSNLSETIRQSIINANYDFEKVNDFLMPKLFTQFARKKMHFVFQQQKLF